MKWQIKWNRRQPVDIIQSKFIIKQLSKAQNLLIRDTSTPSNLHNIRMYG